MYDLFYVLLPILSCHWHLSSDTLNSSCYIKHKNCGNTNLCCSVLPFIIWCNTFMGTKLSGQSIHSHEYLISGTFIGPTPSCLMPYATMDNNVISLKYMRCMVIYHCLASEIGMKGSQLFHMESCSK